MGNCGGRSQLKTNQINHWHISGPRGISNCSAWGEPKIDKGQLYERTKKAVISTQIYIYIYICVCGWHTQCSFVHLILNNPRSVRAITLHTLLFMMQCTLWRLFSPLSPHSLFARQHGYVNCIYVYSLPIPFSFCSAHPSSRVLSLIWRC